MGGKYSYNHKYHKKYKVDANKDKFETTEDTTTPLVISFADLLDNDKGKGLRVVDATDPKNGTLTETATGYTYVPDANFSGTDYFKYKVVDKYGKVDWAVVKVKVAPANDAPVAGDDCYYVKESRTLESTVATNDRDPDGDTLTYALVPNSGPASGTLVFNANGTFTYTPEKDTDRDSETVTFRYTVSDGKGGTDEAVATIKIKDDYGQTPGMKPVAGDDKYYVKEKGKLYGNVSLNDTDPDGTADGDPVDLSFELISGPREGKLYLNEDTGAFCFKPSKDKDWKDEKVTFTYRVTDEQGQSDTATVTICIDDNWGKKKYYDDDHGKKKYFDHGDMMV